MASRFRQVRHRIVDRMANPWRFTDDAALRRAVAGKTVLVTGASYGLGEATAKLLARHGATVLMIARTADRLEQIAAEIDAEGGKAFAYPADLTDFDGIGPLVEQMLAEHGGVDILVSNAGKSIRRSLDLQYDRFHDFTRLVNVNYLGPVRLMLALLPHMRARGSGLIVNVSTVGAHGIPPGPRWGVYQSTKSAFDIWLRSVTPELATDGVDVSTIYMTLIYTRMSAPTLSMQKLPGMDADDAAGLVARAIVRREREIAPVWAVPSQAGQELMRGVLARGMTVMYRRTGDSPSALGYEPPPDSHPRAGARGRRS